MRINYVSLPLAQQEGIPSDLPDPNDPEEPPTDSGSEHELVAFDQQTFEKLLQRECKLWQRKLRLQDWNVQVILCRLNEMPNKDCVASIHPVMERKDAKMMLLSPTDLPLLSAAFLNNEEVNYGLTIVHELLHLHLYAFTQKLTEAETVAEEQAVNAISRSIVDAHSHKIKPLRSSAMVEPPVGHYL